MNNNSNLFYFFTQFTSTYLLFFFFFSSLLRRRSKILQILYLYVIFPFFFSFFFLEKKKIFFYRYVIILYKTRDCTSRSFARKDYFFSPRESNISQKFTVFSNFLYPLVELTKVLPRSSFSTVYRDSLLLFERFLCSNVFKDFSFLRIKFKVNIFFSFIEYWILLNIYERGKNKKIKK